MKYETELVIDLPRTRVIELFDNPENLSKWQSGLTSFMLLSGEQGEPGDRSRLIYDIGGRRVEMIETVLRRELPEEFSGTYETRGIWNKITNHFFAEGQGKTRWVVTSEYEFSGLMKFLGLFMRASFLEQSRKMRADFKHFVESQANQSWM